MHARISTSVIQIEIELTVSRIEASGRLANMMSSNFAGKSREAFTEGSCNYCYCRVVLQILEAFCQIGFVYKVCLFTT
jgi:hypothetical protein